MKKEMLFGVPLSELMLLDKVKLELIGRMKRDFCNRGRSDMVNMLEARLDKMEAIEILNEGERRAVLWLSPDSLNELRGDVTENEDETQVWELNRGGREQHPGLRIVQWNKGEGEVAAMMVRLMKDVEGSKQRYSINSLILMPGQDSEGREIFVFGKDFELQQGQGLMLFSEARIPGEYSGTMCLDGVVIS